MTALDYLYDTADLLSDADIDAMIADAKVSTVRPIDSRWDVRRIARTLDCLRKQKAKQAQEYEEGD